MGSSGGENCGGVGEGLGIDGLGYADKCLWEILVDVSG